MDDNELIKSYVEDNNELSFNLIYEKYIPFKYSMLRRYNTINLDKEDIEAEIDLIFFKAVKKFDYTQTKTKFFTYLNVLCINHLNNLYKKNKVKIQFVDLKDISDDENNIDLIIDKDNGIENLIDDIIEDQLKDEIEFYLIMCGVKQEHINIFIDFYFNGCKHKELVKRYDINANNISTILHRIKHKLLKGEILK